MSDKTIALIPQRFFGLAVDAMLIGSFLIATGCLKLI